MYIVRLLKDVAVGKGVNWLKGEELSGPDVYNMVAAGYAEPVNNNAKRRLALDIESKRLRELIIKQRETERLEKVALKDEVAVANKNAAFAKKLGIDDYPAANASVVESIEPEDGQDLEDDESDDDDDNQL